VAGIELEQLTKVYGDGTRAVRELDLDVGDGEFVALVGPSGCGKSTMLRMIAGLEEITAGEVRIDGKPVNSETPKQRNIAMVFQNYALYPHMNVYDNMAFGLKMRRFGRAEIEARVQAAAEILGIQQQLRRKPRQLSGGQRQRVALGRAIVRHPKVFLFDEPLSNLDAKLRVQMRIEIKRLHQRLNATSIFVTHDQIEAMTLADRVVVLDRGRLQQVGTPEELYQRPANRFVASFIGSPSMNFFETDLTGGTFLLAGVRQDTGIRISGRVTIGMRPEALQVGPDMKGRVLWVETLGAHSLVGVQFDKITLTALLRSRPAADTIDLSIDPAQIHVFDNESGKNLRSVPPFGRIADRES